MTQLRVGSWAHAALGMLCDEHSGGAFFIELQDDNLERLQRALYAAALSKRCQSDVPLSALQATFASVGGTHERRHHIAAGPGNPAERFFHPPT